MLKKGELSQHLEALTRKKNSRKNFNNFLLLLFIFKDQSSEIVDFFTKKN